MMTRKDTKIKRKDAKLSEKEVEHVASLANLQLSPKEVKKFQKQLSKVLEYIEILNKADSDKVEPTSQVTGLENVFREDEEGKTFTQEEALSGAKKKHQGRFKVKAIFEEF